MNIVSVRITMARAMEVGVDERGEDEDSVVRRGGPRGDARHQRLAGLEEELAGESGIIQVDFGFSSAATTSNPRGSGGWTLKFFGESWAAESGEEVGGDGADEPDG